MDMIDFIVENLEQLRQDIYNWHGVKAVTREEIEDFILNDNGLYNWAQREGVSI